MGLYILCIGCKIERQYSWTTQVGTPITCRNLYWKHNISCRIRISGSKPRNRSRLTSISCGFWWWIFHSSIHEGRHNKPKLYIYFATQITYRCTREYWTQGYLVHSISWERSQRNPKSRDEHHSREYQVVTVCSTRIRRSGHQGSVCLWSDQTSSLKGILKHIKFK